MRTLEPVHQTVLPAAAVLLILSAWVIGLVAPQGWSGLEMVGIITSVLAALLAVLSAIFASIAFAKDHSAKGRVAELVRGLALSAMILFMAFPMLASTEWDGLVVFAISTLGIMVCGIVAIVIALVTMRKGQWHSWLQEVSALATPLALIVVTLSSMFMPTALLGILGVLTASLLALIGFVAGLVAVSVQKGDNG